MKKIFLLVFGFIFLGLGSIGLFLPILPTTPFILVSSICFASSSKKMSEWLEKNPYFRSYIENYRTNNGIPYYVKKRSIISLWTGLTLSMILTKKLMITVILTLIGIGVSIHILTMKTKEEV